VTENGAPLSGAASRIHVQAPRGTVGSVSDLGNGNYSFLLTPAGTGEHPLTIRFAEAVLRRTPLVLGAVDANWGQPMAVEGLVNTPGYEDGVSVSADGEYLFLQYGAFYWSGIVLFGLPRTAGGCGGNRLVPSRCSHPWLDDVIGPIGAPERPGFFRARISADGSTYLHNSVSYGWGIDESPLLLLTTMFYGFHRQPDGSFAEPFFLAFDDEGDGIQGPYGLSPIMLGGNLATVAFAWDDPTDADKVDLDGDGIPDVQSLTDVFTLDVTLGVDTLLGALRATGIPGEPPVRSTPFPSRIVDFGHTGLNGIAGTQGNPHLFERNGAIQSIWTDDERDGDSDTGDLSVFVLESGRFPQGTWSKAILPAPVNTPDPNQEIQPFFTGQELFFTRLGGGSPGIYASAYRGGNGLLDYSNAGNWSLPTPILQAGFSAAREEVVSVGEPSIADRSDGRYLYFVYAKVRDNSDPTGIPDLDFQAGYVLHR